jgi:PAS domain S-box-containing protein
MSRLFELLERLTLRVKLLLGFGSVQLLALLLGAQGLLVQSQFGRDFERLQSEEVVGVGRAKEAEIQLVRMVLALHKAGDAPVEAERDEYLKELEGSQHELRLAVTQLRSTLMRPDNLQRMDEFEALLVRLEKVAAEAVSFIRSGELEKAQAFIDGGVFEEIAQQADERMARIAATKERAAETASEEISGFVARQTKLSVSLLIGGLAFTLLSSGAIALSIRRPSSRVRAAVETIAQGRLDERVPHADLPNEVGDLARSVTALRDSLKQQAEVLERQRAALELARAWYQGIVEAAPDGMLIVDAEGRVLLTNPQLDRLFGYGEGELLGQPMEMLVPPESRTPHPQLRAGFMSQGGARQMAGSHASLEGQRKDGTRFAIEIGLSQLPAVEGRGMCVCASVRDIAERKAAEAEVQRAREMAEEATRAKSDFLANMSHEIRTPMNAIIGMSHLALKTELDKRQRNYIEKVHRAAENLLGIINDILDFSKIEAGKLTLERVDFRLEDVLDEFANMVGLKAEAKGLELLFSMPNSLPMGLVGDPLRLGQVLVNLGNNAVKFTDTGEVVVDVEVQEELADELLLHFRVRDTGIGMTPEQTERMFKAFSQADSSITRRYGGTGLGLTISKNLVERMDGRIWIDSEAGMGSTFHFTARFGRSEQDQPRRMFKADELVGLRALVVDDNASAREILSAMALAFGLEVDVAQSGAEALVQVAANERRGLPYHLVLLDWKMPGMDGIEAAHRIDAQSPGRAPPVIMVTAFGRDEAAESADKYGVRMPVVLTKPVTSSTLLEAVGQVLNKEWQPSTRSRTRSDRSTADIARLAGARVLLVEDNDMNQELAQDLLESAAIQVVIASNGEEAVQLLVRDAEFDGVLMDCQMPVLDGYSATRLLRAQARFQHLPIIALTANAMAGDRERALESGMNDHIAKPLDEAAMFATMAKWIRPSRYLASVGIPAHDPQALEDMLPLLPGIDQAAGLATCQGKLGLYRRMLLKFRDSQAGFDAVFAAALEGDDPSAPERVAHTLKGTASNIGATAVARTAAAVEEACRQGIRGDALAQLVAGAGGQLVVVMAGLQTLEAKAIAPAKTSNPGISVQSLTSSVERLRQLLVASDPAALELVSDLKGLLAGHVEHKATVQRIADKVNDFEFDDALGLLNLWAYALEA